jgi:hypothetical protein
VQDLHLVRRTWLTTDLIGHDPQQPGLPVLTDEPGDLLALTSGSAEPTPMLSHITLDLGDNQPGSDHSLHVRA